MHIYMAYIIQVRAAAFGYGWLMHVYMTYGSVRASAQVNEVAYCVHLEGNPLYSCTCYEIPTYLQQPARFIDRLIELHTYSRVA